MSGRLIPGDGEQSDLLQQFSEESFIPHFIYLSSPFGLGRELVIHWALNVDVNVIKILHALISILISASL